MDPVDLVKHYLRGQNLEQLGRVEEAIESYETAVEGGFDSPGPYDRLIALYGDEALHGDVVRVVDAALANVHTYPDKRTWYERVKREAGRAVSGVPKAVPKRG
jgi:hypothetical protein